MIVQGDCVALMAELAEGSVDAIVTDPPYGLEFMGKEWDSLQAKGRGARVRERRAAERTPEGQGHSTSKGPYLAAGVDWQGANQSKMQEWHEAWAREALRILKPGGHLLAFGGTRTYHRLACAIEDAGFEIRDCLAWLYGSGFPKSLDVSKAIDKAARGVPQGGSDPTSEHHGQYRTTTTEGKRWDGDSGQSYGAGGSRFLATTASERTAQRNGVETADTSQPSTLDATATEWQGWGTALKPAHEPIVLARKPLAGTVAQNVLATGCGALNIDGCRIEHDEDVDLERRQRDFDRMGYGSEERSNGRDSTPLYKPGGRWPANVLLDEQAAVMLDEQTGTLTSGSREAGEYGRLGYQGWDQGPMPALNGDSGGASRFLYIAKASSAERNAGLDGFEAEFSPTMNNGIGGKEHDPETATRKRNVHPTVKPIELMRWLVRLVTPLGGTVLDPFTGSGTTGCAAALEGFNFIGMEREAEYVKIAEARIAWWSRHPDGLEIVKALEADRERRKIADSGQLGLLS